MSIRVHTLRGLAAIALTIAVVHPVLAAGQRAIVPPPAGMTLSHGEIRNGLTLNVGNLLPPAYLRQVVPYRTGHAPGTIVVNTGEKHLYLVLGNGQAMRYGIGVARDGFEWSGTHRITRKAEWPGWTPPAEMRKREPHLPAYMPGGIDNPLGARALYIGNTLYRLHGTNQPWTIGGNVSSGCIRLTNEDVKDLYSRVHVGAKVIVL